MSEKNNSKQGRLNLNTLAEIFDVSIVTISRALNDKDGVSDELKAKIQKTANELGYRPNVTGRSLKTQRLYNVGILIADHYVDSQEAYYFSVYGEIIKKLVKLGYSGIMEILMKEDEEKLKLPKMYLEGKIDGLIVLGQLDEVYLNNLENIDIPLVYVDFYRSDSNVDSIVIDNFFSSYEVTKMLLQKGHEKIGFVGNIFSTSSIQDRYLGYYKALLEEKILLNNEYLISDRDGLGQLIDINLPKEMPTAFVVNCDRVAYKLFHVLKLKKYKVPEDVSIVSFDNAIYSTLTDPMITTVDNNVLEMVDKAVNIITKKIAKPSRTYGRVLVKSKVIKRDSIKELI